MIYQINGAFFGMDLVTDAKTLVDTVNQGHMALETLFPGFEAAIAGGMADLALLQQHAGVVTYLNEHVQVHPTVEFSSPGSTARLVVFSRAGL